MSINAITGYNGIYTGKVQNPSIAYGMNAANNMAQYMTQRAIAEGRQPVTYAIEPSVGDDVFIESLEKFASKLEEDEYSPSEYGYKYAKVEDNKVDKLSLFGAAYEELDRREQISVREMNKLLQKFYPAQKVKNKKTPFNAKVLDTNRNRKIDLEEYSTFLAFADVKSKDKSASNPSAMQGTITDKGIKEALSYLAVNAKNPITKWRLTKSARNIFGQFQKSLGLEEAKQQFSNEKEQLNFLA